MTGSQVEDDSLFDGGPPTRLRMWLRPRSLVLPLPSRQITAVLVAWVPLALFAAARGDLIGPAGPGSFVHDFAVHARYLIALPLLLAAQAACTSSLARFARHFLTSGLISDADRGRFDAAVASTRGLRDAAAAEIAIFAAAYAIVATVIYTVSPQLLPAWYLAVHGARLHFSPAGWWHALVSLPLLLIVLIGWFWRLFLWARFLWMMSRLRLKLLPVHPDGMGGLRFVAYSATAHAPLGFVLGVIAAGTVANRIVHEGAALLSFKYLVLGLAGCVVAVIVAPLALFAGVLMSAWQRSVLEYGALADHIGLEFERNWVGRSADIVRDASLPGALTATANVFTLTSRIYSMRFIPVDTRSVIALFGITLVPFSPIILMALPLDVVIKDIAKFLV
jgi:hypothetical protein